jgi:hypothetical protein
MSKILATVAALAVTAMLAWPGAAGAAERRADGLRTNDAAMTDVSAQRYYRRGVVGRRALWRPRYGYGLRRAAWGPRYGYGLRRGYWGGYGLRRAYWGGYGVRRAIWGPGYGYGYAPYAYPAAVVVAPAYGYYPYYRPWRPWFRPFGWGFGFRRWWW